MNARTFQDMPARRVNTPLCIGLIGPSTGGKTYSALRMATGIQRVVGGEIFGIDTEANRMLHYSPKSGKANPANGTFDFRHVPFGAPFGSADYQAAVEHCLKRGARTIVIDSMSHEHEGIGGLIDQHRRDVERRSNGDEAKAKRISRSCWIEPKSRRRELLNAIVQMRMNVIFCFRAKRATGDNMQDLGWVPIGGKDFVFEMTLNMLLRPGCKGVPSWNNLNQYEQEWFKLPGAFEALRHDTTPLSELHGERFARWSTGDIDVLPDNNAPPVADDEPPMGSLKEDSQ